MVFHYVMDSGNYSSSPEGTPPGAPQEPEAYDQYIEALIDFLKAKRDDMNKKGMMPTLDALIGELEDSRYTKPTS